MAPCAFAARRGPPRARPTAAPRAGAGGQQALPQVEVPAARGTGSASCGSAPGAAAPRRRRPQPEELAAREELVQGAPAGSRGARAGRRLPSQAAAGAGKPASRPSAARSGSGPAGPARRPAGASAAGSACRRPGSPAPPTGAGSSACSGGCGRAAAGRTTPPPGAGLLKRPRIAWPCTSSASSAISASATGTPSGAASAAAVTGPRVSSRLRSSSRSDCSRLSASLRRPAWAASIGGSACRSGRTSCELGEPLGAHPEGLAAGHGRRRWPGARPASGASSAGQATRSAGRISGTARNPARVSASCSSSGVARLGPGLEADLADGLRIEPADGGGLLRVQQVPRADRQRAALLGRRVVEERVGPRADDLLGQRRRRRRAPA